MYHMREDATERPRAVIKAETVILDLLSSGGEMLGLELIAKSNDVLSRWSVYVHLENLEAQGLVKSRMVQDKQHPIKRRAYRIA